MSFNFDGTSEYAHCPIIRASLPITMSCWFYLTDTSVPSAIMSFYNMLNNHHQIAYSGSNKVKAESRKGFSSGSAVTSGGVSANTWHHLLGVFSAANNRAVYLDYVYTGTNTTTVNPPLAGGTSYFGTEDGSVEFFPGRLCEFAVYALSLSVSSIAVLAQGYSPVMVLPEYLIFYNPYIKYSTEKDRIVGTGLTQVGTPDVAPHPPIIRPENLNVISQYPRGIPFRAYQTQHPTPENGRIVCGF